MLGRGKHVGKATQVQRYKGDSRRCRSSSGRLRRPLTGHNFKAAAQQVHEQSVKQHDARLRTGAPFGQGGGADAAQMGQRTFPQASGFINQTMLYSLDSELPEGLSNRLQRKSFGFAAPGGAIHRKSPRSFAHCITLASQLQLSRRGWSRRTNSFHPLSFKACLTLSLRLPDLQWTLNTNPALSVLKA